ncbi:hypothetical protein [Thermodesulfobacterium hydrogeniphilum]|uniref:hypothetical protein n=1 Tax=Thermodesulfobacterium hydrogeniphilum TaxID=161156 RepID=UPI00056DD31E|nr:hypothetical protein [Thermodesulfobacterium hydrogeniphilum]
MLNALSTFFPEYKIKIFKNIGLSDKILFPKIIKKGKSNLNLILIDFVKKEPLFFVKLYFAKPLTGNRLKKTLNIIEKLETLDISFIKPLALFYLSPLKAYIKRKSFYGGIIYPFIKTGFINKKKILEFKKQEKYEKFLNKLIEFLFKLHEKGVFLRDTKLNNFWYEKNEIKIFDLDGIKFYPKSLSKKLRLKDLSTLAMSLEWVLENKSEKSQIFDLYKNLYPLNEKDFLTFTKFVENRYQKRLKTYQK